MATPAPSKYALKSLHEEIALFDRKLAHMQNFETFSSEKDRLAAHTKMTTKRGQLVKAAQKMTDAGIECDDLTIAQSAETAESVVSNATASSSDKETAARAAHAEAVEPAHIGSVLDFRNSIDEYKKRRKMMA